MQVRSEVHSGLILPKVKKSTLKTFLVWAGFTLQDYYTKSTYTTASECLFWSLGLILCLKIEPVRQ